jgi:hypothetical protein
MRLRRGEILKVLLHPNNTSQDSAYERTVSMNLNLKGFHLETIYEKE